MRNTKVRATVILAAVWVLVFTIGMATTATSQSRSQKIDYYQEYWVPCANDGAGELVVITGKFNIVQNVTMDNNGCYHVSVHGNSMGMTAEGQETGDTYRANGNASIIQQDYTFCDETCDLYYQTIDNFLMIAAGSGAKLRVHAVTEWHYDVCTEILTMVDQKISVVCK